MADSDLVTKNADALTIPSRAFYERAVFKMFLSLFYAAIGLFYLGLVSQGKCQFVNVVWIASKRWIFVVIVH